MQITHNPSSGAAGITSVTSQSASGATVDFNDIPSTAKRIIVSFNEVKTNGSSNYLLQIGDSGGIEVTGYTAACSYVGGAGNSDTTGSTAGFIYTSGVNNTVLLSGSITLELSDPPTNTWTVSGIDKFLINGNTYGTFLAGGAKALSGILDRVRITTVNGTDLYNAGTIGLSYE